MTQKDLLACLGDITRDGSNALIEKDTQGFDLLISPDSEDNLAECLRCTSQSSQYTIVPLYSKASYTRYAPDSSRAASDDKQRYPPSRPSAPVSTIGLDLQGLVSIAYDGAGGKITAGSGVIHSAVHDALKQNDRIIAGQIWNEDESLVEYAVNGGFGHHSRHHGLLLDYIQTAEAILLNGEKVILSNSSYEDLFWGIRGGGTSLAIITSLTLDTLPTPPAIHHYSFTYPTIDTRLPIPTSLEPEIADLFQIIQDYGDWEAARSEISLIWFAEPVHIDGDEGIKHGLSLGLEGDYIGPVEDFEKLMTRLDSLMRDAGIFSMIKEKRTMTYDEALRNNGDIRNQGNKNQLCVLPGCQLKTLVTKSDITRTPIKQHFADLIASIQRSNNGDLKWSIKAHYIGGLQSALRINKDMAYGHRGLQLVWVFTVIGRGEKEGETLMGRLSGSLGTSHGVYPLWDNSPAVYSDVDNYGKLAWSQNYQQLQMVKQKYDPGNVISFQGSIKPSPADGGQVQETSKKRNDPTAEPRRRLLADLGTPGTPSEEVSSLWWMVGVLILAGLLLRKSSIWNKWKLKRRKRKLG